MVLDFESALKIVIKRGELMGEAAQQSSGSMAAIIGLDLATIESTIHAIEGVKIANYNSPVQYVISGISDAVSTALATDALAAWLHVAVVAAMSTGRALAVTRAAAAEEAAISAIVGDGRVPRVLRRCTGGISVRM